MNKEGKVVEGGKVRLLNAAGNYLPQISISHTFGRG